MNRDPSLAYRGAAPAPAVAWRELHAAASAPYRRAGRFAWHFARGKLQRDPVFRALLERGELRASARVLDLGCGQALLASLLAAIDAAAARGAWPASWPPPPAGCRYTGIELMPRDIERARDALRPPPRLYCADLRVAVLPACDIVVILDVLHYIAHAEQQALLQRVHDALAPRGRLLLRVGDAASRRGFAISQWVDRTVTRLRGHRVAPMFGRTLDDWVALLEQTGFAVQRVPMSRGTPFANVLLLADKR
jgi:SAM-dependent methyltransferase